MPQTREHLDICDLLGVRRGVVALTKRDLVDDDWLALVARRRRGARSRARSSTDAPIVAGLGEDGRRARRAARRAGRGDSTRCRRAPTTGVFRAADRSRVHDEGLRHGRDRHRARRRGRGSATSSTVIPSGLTARVRGARGPRRGRRPRDAPASARDEPRRCRGRGSRARQTARPSRARRAARTSSMSSCAPRSARRPLPAAQQGARSITARRRCSRRWCRDSTGATGSRNCGSIRRRRSVRCPAIASSCAGSSLTAPRLDDRRRPVIRVLAPKARRSTPRSSPRWHARSSISSSSSSCRRARRVA